MDTGDGIQRNRVSRGTQSSALTDLPELQPPTGSSSSTLLSIPLFKKNFSETWSTFPSDVLLCAAVLTGISVYSLICIACEPFENRSDNVKEGWYILQVLQDRTDREWNLWTTEQGCKLLGLFGGHIAFSLFLSYVLQTSQVIKIDAAIQRKDNFQFVFGVILLCFLYGLTLIAFIALICVFFYIIGKIRTYALTIIFGLVFLYYVKQASNAQYEWEYGELDIDVVSQTILTYAILRCCSFSFESTINPSLELSLIDVLRYCFYVPFFFSGPLMTYNNFIVAKQELSTPNAFPFLRHLSRTIIYIIVLDLLRHFFYISAIASSPLFLLDWDVPAVVIGFLAFSNVYFEWLKSYFLYSFSSGIARNIDCYLTAPYNSKNIATVHTFSETYFDKALHPFIYRYIYEKISRDHRDCCNESIAAAASFAAVVVIGKTESPVFVWATITWFCFSIEIFSNQYAKNFVYAVAGKYALLMCYGINYWLIVLTKCIKINGIHTFIILLKRIFFYEPFDAFLSLVIGICFARVNVEMKKRKKVNNMKANCPRFIPTFSSPSYPHIHHFPQQMYQWLEQHLNNFQHSQQKAY